jgi:cytochrome P450
MESVLLFRDPPVHTRLRSLLRSSFTGPEAERKRVTVAAQIDRQLNMHVNRGGMDFIEDFSRVVPMMMICDFIGLPYERHEDISRWGISFATLQLPAMTDEQAQMVERDFAEYRDFL